MLQVKNLKDLLTFSPLSFSNFKKKYVPIKTHIEIIDDLKS